MAHKGDFRRWHICLFFLSFIALLDKFPIDFMPLLPWIDEGF
jgi:hypothetical protein